MNNITNNNINNNNTETTEDEDLKTIYDGICYSIPLPTRSFFYDETVGVNSSRIKTIYLIFTLCLNIGTEPPDQIKQKDSASKECWIDTAGKQNRKIIYDIAANLQEQFKSWCALVRVENCLDPTFEDVRRVCCMMRRSAENDRVLFYYNGHGVPLPTLNGEIWFFDAQYSQYVPLQIFELMNYLDSPTIYIFECSCAGRIINWCKKFAHNKQKRRGERKQHKIISCFLHHVKMKNIYQQIHFIQLIYLHHV